MTKEIEYVPSNFSMHCFSCDIGETKYLYQTLKMEGSLLIFVNVKGHRDFSDLAVAMQSRFDKLPVSAKIMGNFNEDRSKELSAKLSKKLGKTVFVSLNVQLLDNYSISAVEKQLFLEIKNKPQSF